MIERENLQQALNRANQALAIMEEHSADYGSLDIHVHLKIELEDKLN